MVSVNCWDGLTHLDILINSCKIVGEIQALFILNKIAINLLHANRRLS